MKALLLTALVGLAAMTAVSRAGASQDCAATVLPGTARLTIKALHILDRPIRTTGLSDSNIECNLSYGTVWDPGSTARPGDGQTMVIYGHDVTPVWGYSHDTQGHRHGPFYWLYKMKPGQLMQIKWRGNWWNYRLAAIPHAYRQCASKRINDSLAHLNNTGQVVCAPYDKPID
ncbi:MAG TPA: hypothetical protein VFH37_03675, partial [Candidatus Saccharimonadales bacterium]|nr:hypothetical protein [Candidatus Saccharimonadales bacterium]